MICDTRLHLTQVSWEKTPPACRTLVAAMAEIRADPSETSSEERTEPFSQNEMRSHFGEIAIQGPSTPSDEGDVALDNLQVEDHHHEQGIRILVRPLAKLPNYRSISPGHDGCQWLALRAEVATSDQPEYKVLAVTQTSRDIKFSVRIPGDARDDLLRPPLWCELYYDPASDKVIFLNKSHAPLCLSKVSQASPPSSSALSERLTINPGNAKGLRPGTWRITVRDLDVLDFRVLEKRPITVYPPMPAISEKSSPGESSDLIHTSAKRPSSPAGDEKRIKRRVSDTSNDDGGDGVVMFLRPAADPLVFPLPTAQPSREITTASSHALLDTAPGECVIVPAVCELDQYRLTRRDPIASSTLSDVYTASHSQVPEDIVTVKVLKTRVPNAADKPSVSERNVIRQADMWLRESQSQEGLEHESIVRYYGGDARFLSLYMEHVDAKDLTSASRWRSKATDEFLGTRDDALRIMTDITGALRYIHSRQLVHNDIKPANILYSRARGAVLCDFGLSTYVASPPGGGGTPYYVPPEFIGGKLRGPSSDVWALGVTMLYLLRKISFPDGRARRHHPKPLYWQIAGINNPTIPYRQHGNGQPAVDQMRDWLGEVFEATEKLNPGDHLEKLVQAMLAPNPLQRITMSRVMKQLYAENTVAVR